MKHFENIFDEVIADMTTAPITGYKGKRPDQNFDADELDWTKFGAFLDLPFKSKGKLTQNNIAQHTLQPVSIFFCMKSDFDGVLPDKFTTIKQVTWALADEFLRRYRAYNKDGDIDETLVKVEADLDFEFIDVDNVFDINLTGTLLTFTPKLNYAGSKCLV